MAPSHITAQDMTQLPHLTWQPTTWHHTTSPHSTSHHHHHTPQKRNQPPPKRHHRRKARTQKTRFGHKGLFGSKTWAPGSPGNYWYFLSFLPPPGWKSISPRLSKVRVPRETDGHDWNGTHWSWATAFQGWLYIICTYVLHLATISISGTAWVELQWRFVQIWFCFLGPQMHLLFYTGMFVRIHSFDFF